MKKILLVALSLIGSLPLSFAQGMMERPYQHLGGLMILTAGAGGLVLLAGIILAYVSVSYGISLLSKRYAPKVHPAWSWIPIAQAYPLVAVSGESPWWIVGILVGGVIPIIGWLISLVSIAYIYHKIAEKTGRGAGTTALLVFFSVITLPWLGLTVNKKNVTTAWVLGISAIVLISIGMILVGAGAFGGVLGARSNEYGGRMMQGYDRDDNRNMMENYNSPAPVDTAPSN